MTELLNEAIKASVAAGLKILEICNDRVRIRIKRNFTPVTNVDKAANQLIVDRLSLSGIPIISEESAITAYEQRISWNSFWLIDPLDGTKEFISKSMDYSVNIALIKNNIPVIGVIYAPAYDHLYFTGDINGSYKLEQASKFVNVESANGIENLISLSTLLPNKKTDTYTYIVSKSHINGKTRRYLNNDTNPKRFIRKGSSLKLCLIAEGEADEYPRFGRTMEWDTAAGDAILRNAGGHIGNVVDLMPLQYNKKDLSNPYFIARRSE